MKSVLISIQPKWCEKIANGEKTFEIRKTKPKLETPFKVYIYMTREFNRGINSCFYFYKYGKVIGEFVCDYIISHCEMANADIAEQRGCIKREKLLEYANGKELYGWHISNLVIYDKPRELSEFYRECERPECEDCSHLHFENTPNSYEGWCEFDEKIPIKRPPQSWCYVETTSQTERGE